MIKLLALIAWSLLTAGCTAPPRVWPSLGADAPEDLQVIYAVVDHELGQGWRPSRAVPENILVMAELHSMTQRVWQDQIELLNEAPSNLQYPAAGAILDPTTDSERCFRILRRIEFEEGMGSSEFEWPQEYWDAFHAAFPKAWGYYSFIRPTFSADGQSCVVGWVWSCGPLCMNWMLARLKRTDGNWAVFETVLLGVA
jgi:hypothetical protein